VNKTQKLILAFFIPIIFFFIAVFIASSVGVTSGSNASWCVWLVYSAFCCLFEFLLFRDNKIIARKNKED